MADELDPVTQEFIANVEEYVDEVKLAADSATEFAAANEEAKVSLDGMRDKAIEAAAALGIYRDEQGKLRDAAGRFVAESKLQEMGLEGIRDKAVEATVAMHELKAEEDKAGRAGLFSRLGGLLGGGAGGAFNAIPGESVPAFLNPAVIVPALAGIMAIGTEVGALATGLLAAGAGVAAFGAVAIPNLTATAKAAQQVQQAQDAYNAKIASGVKQATAYRAEQIAIREAYAELSPAQVQLSQSMGALQNQWQSFVQANTPAVAKVLTQAVGIIGQLLPWLQQFASVATPVIAQMLGGISKFIESPNFGGFMTFLSQLSGPALLAIGSGFEGLTIRVMRLFEMFSQKDVINSINIAFRLLGFTIELVQGLILEGMDAWDLLTAGLHNTAAWFDRTRHAAADFAHNIAAHFDEIRRDAGAWAHDMAHWFDDVRHGIMELAHDFAAWFDEIRHNIMSWSDNVVHFFEQLPHRIVQALGDLLYLLLQAGKDIIQGLLNGLQSAAGSVLNFIGNLAGTISSTFTGFLGMRSPSRVFAQHGRDTLLGYIEGLQSAAPQVRSALAGIGGGIAAGGLPGITGGGYGGAVPARPVINLTANFAPGTQGYNDPRFLQYLQAVVQEAILRYNVSNPSNGLAITAGGRL